MWSHRLHTRPRRYGMALAGVIVASLLRYGVDVAVGTTPPFILFYPTIMLIALLGGFGPGLFATLGSAAIAEYFFLEPQHSFALSHPSDIVGLALFVAMGIAISGMGGLFRRRGQRLQEFEKAVEGLDEMIVVVDRDYRYVIANRSFLKYRGVQREDLIGRRISDVVNPAIFGETAKGKLDECFRGKIVQFEMRYEYPSMGQRDVSVCSFPIEGQGGVDRVASVIKDITEQKEAERTRKLFRTLIDQSNDAVKVVDPETLRFLDVNEKACKDLGYSREELLTMTVFDINRDIDESVRNRVFEVLQRVGFIVREGIHWRKDGSTFPVETSLKLVQLEQKYVITVSRDISERAEAEKALRQSEDRYRDLVENSQDLVCTHDLQGNLLSVNPAPARALGYEVEELLKIPMQDVVVPGGRQQFNEYLERIERTGADQGLLCVVARNGERRIWEYKNTLRTEGVAAPIVRGMARDVTERRMAQEALRRSEADLNRAQAVAHIGSWRFDIRKNMITWSDEGYRIMGLPTGQPVTPERARELVHPDDREIGELAWNRVGADGKFEVESRVLVEGRTRWIRGEAGIEVDADGQPVAAVGTIQDITERKQAEEALKASENHFQYLVEQASDGIFTADASGRYTDVNSAGASMLGYTREELLQLSIPDIIVKEEVPRVATEVRRFAGGAVVLSEWKFRRKDGSSFPGEVCGKQLPDGRLQGILRDISERRQAEEAMRLSEERFRVALKDSPITVFSQDRELRYTWIYNPQLYWQHECLGKTDSEIIGAKKAENLEGLKRRVLATGVALREEVVVPNNGRSSAFDITIEPLFDADGSAIGITGAAMDIARLREMTERLQDAKDKLTQEKSYLESEIQTELGFEEIIGQSPALRQVLKNVRVVAPTDSTVLLLGETGTGKELVARSAHALSSRRDKTFVKLNCAAVPEGLLESELFGHEKGAFTSAVSQKIGRIELADKGTLFLDEIGELPLELPTQVAPRVAGPRV